MGLGIGHSQPRPCRRCSGGPFHAASSHRQLPISHLQSWRSHPRPTPRHHPTPETPVYRTLGHDQTGSGPRPSPRGRMALPTNRLHGLALPRATGPRQGGSDERRRHRPDRHHLAHRRLSPIGVLIARTCDRTSGQADEGTSGRAHGTTIDFILSCQR